jgi:arylsulfatase A-like enzyme
VSPGYHGRDSGARSLARPLLRFAVLVFAVAACAGCSPTPRTPPNLILISIDSLRSDHLGLDGYPRETSPHLDALARSSVVFDQARSVSTWTLPAHVSLLSGLLPNAHGVNLPQRRIPPAVALLPELLAARGYRSAAIISGHFLHRRFGFAQGWETYDDSLVGRHENHRQETSAEIDRRALASLDRLAPGPFLLFLHYFDVHYDYAPPPPWDRRFDPDYPGTVDGSNFARSTLFRHAMPQRDLEHLEALYDGEIRWVDENLGRLFTELSRRGLFEDALIVVTSDHGDEFLDHSSFGHERNLYDSTLHVPLLIRFPRGRDGGRRVATPVSLVDVVPTILRAADVPLPADTEGIDLARVLAGDDRRPQPVVADLRTRRPTRAIVVGRWKAIFGYRPRRPGAPPLRRELYDLAADPGERNDLEMTEPQKLTELERRLAASHRDAGGLAPRFGRATVPGDPEFEKELQALGYL